MLGRALNLKPETLNDFRCKSFKKIKSVPHPLLYHIRGSTSIFSHHTVRNVYEFRNSTHPSNSIQKNKNQCGENSFWVSASLGAVWVAKYRWMNSSLSSLSNLALLLWLLFAFFCQAKKIWWDSFRSADWLTDWLTDWWLHIPLYEFPTYIDR